MSSEVEIVNLALSHLGDTANVASINPPDGSMQAEYAAQFYPQARDTLLEMHDWGFSTTFASLASVANTSAKWGYAYALPANFLKILGTVPSVMQNSVFYDTVQEEVDAFGHPAFGWIEMLQRGFATFNGVVYANEQNAVFAYTQRITDPTKFSPLFVRCLSWLLASDLAGPILKGSVGAAAAKTAFDAFKTLFGAAASIDANQQSRHVHVYPSWIVGR